MKGRIGTKNYDTDKSELIETRPDGIQVYRKKGRSAGNDYYLYNPQGRTAKEKFFDLPPEQAIKYVSSEIKKRQAVRNSLTLRINLTYIERIQTLALQNGMSVNKFIMMLVDEYEQRQRDLSKD